MYLIITAFTVNCFCLIFASKPYDCLTGLGRPDWKRQNVLCPRAANGRDFACYGRSGLNKSWTVPDSHKSQSQRPSCATFFEWFPSSALCLSIKVVRLVWVKNDIQKYTTTPANTLQVAQHFENTLYTYKE